MNDTDDARYVCSVCNAAYDAETAAVMSFVCHDVQMERVVSVRHSRRESTSAPSELEPPTVAERLKAMLSPAAEPPLFAADGEQAAIEIVPPRVNDKNAQAISMLLASLGVGQPFSLEIASDSNGRRFLVRGAPALLDHIAHQIRAVYEQVECLQLLPQDDPGRKLAGELVKDPEATPRLLVAAGRLKLRRPEFFPLRTYTDLKEGDPILSLLGGFAGLREQEHLLSQVVLAPAPDNWSDLYQGAAKDMTPQAQKMSPPGQLMIALLSLGVIWAVIAILVLLSIGDNPFGMIALALVTAGIWGGLLWTGRKVASTMNADPNVVKRKIDEPGYLADIRLWAAAPDAAQARQLLGRVAGAYRSFNTASGNALELAANDLPVTPLDISREGLRHARVLNVYELATMWHLPLGENPDQVRQGLYQRFLPVPSAVNEPCSVRVGQAIKGGQVVPVALSPLAVRHNILILGKTQKGKTTVAGHLAQSIMAEPGHALVVIAPHRDFAEGLLQIIPERRVEDVIYVDLGREDRSVGLNLMDVSGLKMKPDKIVSDLVSLGRTIWRDYWGPRMESALSYSAQTLAYANLRLKPEEQFTLLDLPYLLYADGAFRERVLAGYVDAPDILRWWSQYYGNSLSENFRQEIINPVLTKIDAFSRARAVRNVIAQSRSTINLRDAITRGKIVLIHTAPGEVGTEIGGFMGAVMLNYLNAVVREQIALDPQERPRVTVIIDEFQSIAGVDYGALLSELLKMGASFVLANQSLAQLDAIHPALKGTVFSNIDTLIAFQTSGEDARYLYNELDQKVKPPDLTNLRPYECYLKTVDRHGNRLPVFHMETLAPPPGSSDVARKILELMARYTVSADQIEANLVMHAKEWHKDAGNSSRRTRHGILGLPGGQDADAYARFSKAVSEGGTQGQDAMTKRPPSPPGSGGDQPTP